MKTNQFRVMGVAWVFGLMFTGGLIASTQVWAVPERPEGLSAVQWQGIATQIKQTQQARAYEATRRGNDWVATNPAHGFSIRYAEKGHTELELTGGDAKPHRIALKPKSVGYAGGEALSLIEPLAREAEGETVTTQWSSELSEWWVNSDKGLEQWFELTERPKASTDPNAPLVVNLELDSTLQANLRGEGSQQFLHLSGPETSVHFEKLKVFDANGGDVPATLRLDGKVLSYVIDDRQADYPLTIDPTFTQQQRLDQGADGTASDWFGGSVAISGDVLVVGAPNEDSSTKQIDGTRDDAGDTVGAAFVFRLENETWVQKAFLKAPDGVDDDYFGSSVAISGNTIVVGSNQGSSVTTTGAVDVFVCADFEADPACTHEAALVSDNLENGDTFGSSVAIDGDIVVVGAQGEKSDSTGVNSTPNDPDNNLRGAAYVFERSGTTWSQTAYLKADTANVNRFGSDVSVSGNTVLVAQEQSDNRKMYVFFKDNDTWTPQGTLDQPAGSIAGSLNFVAVGLDGDTAAAHWGDGASSVDVYTRDGSTWTFQATLTATDGEAADNFGVAIAVSGDTVVVGASAEDSNATEVDGDASNNDAANAGAAYVFTRDGSTWSQTSYLKASDAEAGDWFGLSVAASGSTVVVGANSAERTDAEGGAAYVFSSGPAVDSEQLSAINDFASGDSTTDPTPTTYTDAGVTGVDEDNIDAVNAFVTARAALLEDDATLSTADIQALVSVYTAIEAAQADPDTMAVLTQSDFASLGVELSSELVADVLQGVVSNITAGTDTPEGMEALADVAERIATTITGGTPTTPLTAGDFNSVGFTSVSNDNLPFVLTRLADSDPSAFAEDKGDSFTVLQTIITQAQADYAAIPKPVPSLSWWAMLLLGGVLGWGVLMHRRRLA